ncbi:MAG TPA: MoaD/ThiS family protein [Puia sp.]|nr:MoaD/ThiS family protein [Puia sp.]
MPVKVIVFGRIRDLMGSDEILFPGVKDTDQLIQQLNVKYPGLAGAPYIIAVDKEVISGNTELAGEHVVALLPPYSGG